MKKLAFTALLTASLGVAVTVGAQQAYPTQDSKGLGKGAFLTSQASAGKQSSLLGDVSSETLANMMRPNPAAIIPVATEVKDPEAGYRIMIPWRLLDAIRVDTSVPTESGHILGYSFNLDGADDGIYGLSVTKRDNQPAKGVSQKRWNTTWYDQPVKGMTNDKYMAVWKKHSQIFDRNEVEGGLLDVKGAQSARWSVISPKEGKQSLFEAEYIMKTDPTHRYTLTVTYPKTHKGKMEEEIRSTLLPSFGLVPKVVDRSNLDYDAVDTGIRFLRPKDFTMDESVYDHLSYRKGPIHLDVSTLPANNGGLLKGYPTLPGKQTLANAYIKSIRAIPDSDVVHCEAFIEGHEVGYLINGYSGQEAFTTYLVLTDDNRLAVAKLTAPRGTNLLADNLKAIVKGLKVDAFRDTAVATYVL